MLELAQKEYEMNGKKIECKQHIVCLKELIHITDRMAFVLEYCNRGSLHDLVENVRKQNEFLAPSTVLQFFKQVVKNWNLIKHNFKILLY